MVRRDATEASARVDAAAARCVLPVGVSPVPASVGAPGSRPQASGGDPSARAGRRKPAAGKPVGRKQARGPQHEVKPAASTEEQSGGRAAHFPAKATPTAPGPMCAVGSGGVRGAARVQGGARNTRDPSAQPSSRQGGSYKPKAKSSAAQRESEGIVVPGKAVKAAGGKGPCGGEPKGSGARGHGRQDRTQQPSWAQAQRQRANAPAEAVGGRQAAARTALSCPDGPHLEG